MKKIILALLGLVLSTAAAFAQTGNGFVFPTASTYNAAAGDSGKVLSSSNVTGGASSITVSLPCPATVGAGWTLNFSTGSGIGIITNAPNCSGQTYIKTGQKTLTSFSAPSNTNYEYFGLQSDGTNFILTAATQQTAAFNGIQTGAAASNWTFLYSLGYAATLTDNGHVLNSAFTGGSNTVTLPSTPLIPNGWAITLYPATNPITLQTNVTSGGSIILPWGGTSVQTYPIPGLNTFTIVSFDGAAFRVQQTVGIPNDIRAWGAQAGALVDASTAINSCLTAAQTQGFSTCFAPGRFLISNNVNIPTATSLQCNSAPTFVEGQSSNGAKWNTVAALVMTSGSQIGASGDGAGLVNCNVLNSALTFPLEAAARSSYGSGVAVTDNGNYGFHLTGDRIVGWDTAALISGPNPTVFDLYYDGNGQNNQCGGSTCVGALIATTGNTDFGYWTNIRSGIGYFFDTGVNFANGCSQLPPGNGFTVAGTVSTTTGILMDNILVEGYKGKQFDIENSVWAGKIWADNFTGAPFNCVETSSVGIYIAANTTFTAQTVNVSRSQVGMTILGSLVHIDELQMGGSNGDAIDFGSGGVPGIIVRIGKAFFSAPGGYCINQQGASSGIVIDQLSIGTNCHAGVAPYFVNTSGSGGALGRYPGFWDIHHLFLPGGYPYTTNLFDSHLLAGPGSETVLTGLQPVITGCTGVGTGGSAGCAFDGNSDALVGAFIITTGTSGMGTNGEVSISAPITPLNTKSCTVSLNGGWQPSAIVTNDAGVNFFWNVNTATPLLANTQYFIKYICAYY